MVSALSTLARMLGLSDEHAEASIHSENAARAVLTRRNLFAAGAALAAGSAFSFAPAVEFEWPAAEPTWADIQIKIGGIEVPSLVEVVAISYSDNTRLVWTRRDQVTKIGRIEYGFSGADE